MYMAATPTHFLSFLKPIRAAPTTAKPPTIDTASGGPDVTGGSTGAPIVGTPVAIFHGIAIQGPAPRPTERPLVETVAHDFRRSLIEEEC